jgi:hypothetical protein
MKIALAIFLVVVSAMLAETAIAQAYPSGAQIRRDISSDRGPLGTLVMPGQIFPAAMPIVVTSTNPAVAALATFQAGTLARNPFQAVAAVCPADASNYIVDANLDLEGAAQHIGKFTTREALGVAQWGPNHVIVLARLRGGSETMLRFYPMRQLTPGKFCLTRDLSGDNALLEVAGFLLKTFSATPAAGTPVK